MLASKRAVPGLAAGRLSGRQRLPHRRARRRGGERGGIRPLGRRHHRGPLGVDVGGEGAAEQLRVQEEVSAEQNFYLRSDRDANAGPIA